MTDLDEARAYQDEYVRSVSLAKRIRQLILDLGYESHYHWVTIEYRAAAGLHVSLCKEVPKQGDPNIIIEAFPIKA